MVRSLGWSEGWQERTYHGTILVAMAMVIPVLRLVAWYGLRLRPKGDDDVQKEVRSSWKPIALLYSILFVIALVAAAVIIPSERRSKREQAQEEANLTVIDSANWNGWPTVSSLREQTKESANATRVVRLRALQKSSAAMTCGNKSSQVDFATVVATIGRHDVLIFSYSGVTRLVQRANGNEGKPIEAIGRLMRMQDNHPAWKKYCGLEELSPKPRWLFEEESP